MLGTTEPICQLPRLILREKLVTKEKHISFGLFKIDEINNNRQKVLNK